MCSGKWLKRMDQTIERIEKRDFHGRRRAHEKWWHDFWTGSWIYFRQDTRPAPLQMIAQNTHPIRIGVDQHGGNKFCGDVAKARIVSEAH